MSVAQTSGQIATFNAPTTSESWLTKAKVITLQAASYLTDPVCKVREYYYSFSIINQTCKTTCEKVLRVFSLTLGIILFVLLTPITAPLGILLRGVVRLVEDKPFVYLQRAVQGKEVKTGSDAIIVSHNECYQPAGYSITDGGVTPPALYRARMDANIENITKFNPDIVCLYEVPDINDAKYIASKLNLPYVVLSAGLRAIGPDSMMLAASRYKIDENSINFTAFEKGTELSGRARWSEKGFLSFDLAETNTTIVSTHMQHSEIPDKPTDDEVTMRKAEIKKICTHINEKIKQNRNVVFVGDFNEGEEELNAALKSYPHEGSWLREKDVEGKPTWGGDKWCATMMKKQVSGPSVMDFAFLAVPNKSKARIKTELFQTGFKADTFNPEALSDHLGLCSTFTLV